MISLFVILYLLSTAGSDSHRNRENHTWCKGWHWFVLSRAGNESCMMAIYLSLTALWNNNKDIKWTRNEAQGNGKILLISVWQRRFLFLGMDVKELESADSFCCSDMLENSVMCWTNAWTIMFCFYKNNSVFFKVDLGIVVLFILFKSRSN